MPLDTSENPWLKKTKILTQALILSSTLNIGLIATFAYFVLKEKQQTLTLELKPALSEDNSLQPTNVELLRSYCLLPYPELLSRLEDKESIEEGLTRRDLSLACLVAFHHFNLDKALGGLPLQKRSIFFSHAAAGETLHLPVFPGLTDAQFAAVSHYAKTEKWPFTNQGLFYELKRSAEHPDPSLLSAFYLTSEYHAAYLILTRSGLRMSQEEIAGLVADGSWEQLAELATEQRTTLDLSPERRLAFLLGYLDHHSLKAATLLATYDLASVAKRCSDVQVLTLLDLYTEKNASFEQFVRELLIAPRTEAVYRKAASMLYHWHGEECKEPYDHIATLQRFLPNAVAKEMPLSSPTLPSPTQTFPTKAPITSKKRMHTVESGDNLWKIARKYKVSIEEIMRINRLESEKLHPGKQLEIPDSQEKRR